MADEFSVQSYKNHARYYPPFHFVLVPLVIVNLVWAAIRLIRMPSGDAGRQLLVAIVLFLLTYLARTFALTVQDRVIRLEMRLRLRQLLPPDLIPRIPEFTPGQLVALRFAGDAELPTLARRVLDERLQDRKVIKQMIQDWQADHLRA